MRDESESEMGYMRDHAIVVAGEYGDYIDDAHRVAANLFGWVSPISPEMTNHCRSFFVPPDGSKEYWRESEAGDAKRAIFIRYLKSLAYDDGSSPLRWIEVQFGDDNREAKVCDASDLMRKTQGSEIAAQ